MRIKEGFQRRLKGGNNVDEAIEYYQKGGHERETNDQDFNVNGRVLYAEVDNSEAELEER